eukprot:249167-Pelagomonas_calceolata.AAC.2
MFWLSNQVAVSEFARAFWRSLLVGCALWEGCGHGRKDLCQLALAARLPPKLRTVHSDMMLLSKLIWTQSGVSEEVGGWHSSQSNFQLIFPNSLLLQAPCKANNQLFNALGGWRSCGLTRTELSRRKPLTPVTCLLGRYKEREYCAVQLRLHAVWEGSMITI